MPTTELAGFVAAADDAVAPGSVRPRRSRLNALARGGLGLGDVKLVAMLGVALGAALPRAAAWAPRRRF